MTNIPASLYRQRREQILARFAELHGDGVLLLPTAPEQVRNGTTDFPYRSDSHFYYLTGFPEPEAVVALTTDRKGKTRHLLFCREKHPREETWTGFRYGVKAARDVFAFDRVFPIDKLADKLPEMLTNVATLATPLGLYPDWDQRILSVLRAIRATARGGDRPPATLIDARDLLAPFRMIKDEHEITLIREAARISALAHTRAMRQPCVGRFEYEIEAEFAHEFLLHGAQAVAYPSIVASGENACVLHYTANNRKMKSGDLLLIDAGCEYQNYAGDITRTFPVGKHFTAAQRDVYQIVLAAQQACFDALRAGQPQKAYHEAAIRVLAQGLIDLKLLKGPLAKVIENKSYQRFYMHSAGHWLGLDVHDAGLHSGKNETVLLQPGMVVTVEPGLYIKAAPDIPAEFHNIGVRIEDDVLITEKGIEILTDSAPKSVREIEALRRSCRHR